MPISVTFRFYEELNLFLHIKNRKIAFEWTFPSTTTVKDAIESLGIPHTEVDLILVNSTPVDFNYQINNNDYISVYPVFESFEIKHLSPLRNKSLRDPTFILDVHLGKLAKLLRLAGFDCLYQTDYEDAEIINISVKEKRIILTRDKGILKNSKVTHGCYIQSDRPRAQLKEIILRLQLENHIQPFSRCTMCNGIIHTIDKASIENQLQPLTKKHFSLFYKCESCGRIYWEGSHFDKMKQFIEEYHIKPNHDQ
jgi:uncharacterized protein with PIN domain/sulfur carrier protein ThiS